MQFTFLKWLSSIFRPRRECQRECPHEHVGDPVERLVRDYGDVQRVFAIERRCRDCGKVVSSRREFRQTDDGKAAVQVAWEILESISPRFRESGSGCLIYFPMAVGAAVLTGGREAGVRKAEELLAMEYDAAQRMFEPLN